MTEHCAKCGATLPAGSTCQTIYEELLGFEYNNAIPHSIHFLQVTCFLIQHERYSDEALVWAQSMLRAHLDETMTEQQLHYLLTKGEKGTARTWKYQRSADAPPLPKIAWSITIADVARNMQDVESYGKLVKQWAHTTLQQMAAAGLNAPHAAPATLQRGDDVEKRVRARSDKD